MLSHRQIFVNCARSLFPPADFCPRERVLRDGRSKRDKPELRQFETLFAEGDADDGDAPDHAEQEPRDSGYNPREDEPKNIAECFHFCRLILFVKKSRNRIRDCARGRSFSAFFIISCRKWVVKGGRRQVVTKSKKRRAQSMRIAPLFCQRQLSLGVLAIPFDIVNIVEIRVISCIYRVFSSRLRRIS